MVGGKHDVGPIYPSSSERLDLTDQHLFAFILLFGLAVIRLCVRCVRIGTKCSVTVQGSNANFQCW